MDNMEIINEEKWFTELKKICEENDIKEEWLIRFRDESKIKLLESAIRKFREESWPNMDRIPHTLNGVEKVEILPYGFYFYDEGIVIRDGRGPLRQKNFGIEGGEEKGKKWEEIWD